MSPESWPQTTEDGWPATAVTSAWSVTQASETRATPETVPAEPAGILGQNAAAAEPQGEPLDLDDERGSQSAVSAPPVSVTVGTADSELWRPLSGGSDSSPAARDRRPFDAVTIFLTVLVAIVIVALLLGFLIFAGKTF